MAFDPESIARAMEKELRRVATKERAVQEKKYLKSEIEHLGANVGQTRGLVKRFKRENRQLDRASLLALAATLWAEPIFERRAVAGFLLEAYAGLLTPDDLPFIEQLLRESKTWALVDLLAPSVAGEIIEAHPKAGRILDRWSKDADFWIRRSSMLALQNRLRRGEAFDQFARYADAMLEEKEFFIRKVIGWMLRETSKKRPDLVHAFMKPRAARASGVTWREAVKYLSPSQRREIEGLAKAVTKKPAKKKPAAKRQK